MEDELYMQALISFNKGEYEEVLKLFLHSKASLSEKEKVILRESRKQVTEQYLFLIKDYIQQKEYGKAKMLQEEYISKYNFDDRVADIEIDISNDILNEEVIVEEQIETATSPERVVVDKESIKSNKRKITILVIISLFLLIASVVGVLMYINREVNEVVFDNSDANTGATISQSNLYTERSKKFLDDLTNQYVHISVIPTQPFRSYPPSLFSYKMA